MRVGLVVVQHHHVLVVGHLGLREFARRFLHDQRVGTARHGQHDVEGFAPIANLFNLAAAETPIFRERMHCVTAPPRIVLPRSSSMSSRQFLLM